MVSPNLTGESVSVPLVLIVNNGIVFCSVGSSPHRDEGVLSDPDVSLSLPAEKAFSASMEIPATQHPPSVRMHHFGGLVVRARALPLPLPETCLSLGVVFCVIALKCWKERLFE